MAAPRSKLRKLVERNPTLASQTILAVAEKHGTKSATAKAFDVAPQTFDKIVAELGIADDLPFGVNGAAFDADAYVAGLLA